MADAMQNNAQTRRNESASQSDHSNANANANPSAESSTQHSRRERNRLAQQKLRSKRKNQMSEFEIQNETYLRLLHFMSSEFEVGCVVPLPVSSHFSLFQTVLLPRLDCLEWGVRRDNSNLAVLRMPHLWDQHCFCDWRLLRTHKRAALQIIESICLSSFDARICFDRNTRMRISICADR